MSVMPKLPVTWAVGCAAVGMLLFTSPVRAGLMAQYKFEGNANDSVGTFHGTISGSPTFVSSPVDGQAISFSGTGNYIGTSAKASDLGIGGSNPKTISAWARAEAFNDGGIWDLGSTGSSGGNFSLRTHNLGYWRSQFWGGDLDFTAPKSLNQWGYYALTYDGTTARAYYNGILMGTLTRSLSTNDGRPLEIGRWWDSYYFQGQIDQLRVYNEAITAAQIAAQFRSDGGFLVDFEDTAGQLPTDWYVSGGSSTVRLRTAFGGVNPDGTYALLTHGGADSPSVPLNVYGSDINNNTSMAWGPIFKVLDASAFINLKIAGGSHPLLATSQRSGGTGVALWDIEANDFVPGSFKTRSSSDVTFEWQSISLAGLEGRLVALVVVDRQVGDWGWTGVDSINAPAGAVSVLDPSMHHRVLLSYDFDKAGDFMGWYQVDSTGNQVPITSFEVGRQGTGGLVARHIVLDGTFALGKGFLSSTISTDSNGPTGILRSPDFTIAGDILEFYISGGSVEGLAFELVRSSDNAVLRSTVHETSDNAFDYMFWQIKDLAGTEAYLRLRDEQSGTWGHIEIDAIRMVAFAVPEPASWVLTVLGGLGVVLFARRTVYPQAPK